MCIRILEIEMNLFVASKKHLNRLRIFRSFRILGLHDLEKRLASYMAR